MRESFIDRNTCMHMLTRRLIIMGIYFSQGFVWF
jgi:hypothetical protein